MAQSFSKALKVVIATNNSYGTIAKFAKQEGFSSSLVGKWWGGDSMPNPENFEKILLSEHLSEIEKGNLAKALLSDLAELFEALRGKSKARKGYEPIETYLKINSFPQDVKNEWQEYSSPPLTIKSDFLKGHTDFYVFLEDYCEKGGKSFFKFISNLRKEWKLSINDFSQVTGFHVNSISNWEKISGQNLENEPKVKSTAVFDLLESKFISTADDLKKRDAARKLIYLARGNKSLGAPEDVVDKYSVLLEDAKLTLNKRNELAIEAFSEVRKASGFDAEPFVMVSGISKKITTNAFNNTGGIEGTNTRNLEMLKRFAEGFFANEDYANKAYAVFAGMCKVFKPREIKKLYFEDRLNYPNVFMFIRLSEQKNIKEFYYEIGIRDTNVRDSIEHGDLREIPGIVAYYFAKTKLNADADDRNLFISKLEKESVVISEGKAYQRIIEQEKVAKAGRGVVSGRVRAGLEREPKLYDKDIIE